MKKKICKKTDKLCLKYILASSGFSSFAIFFVAPSVEKKCLSIFGRRFSRKGRQEPD